MIKKSYFTEAAAKERVAALQQQYPSLSLHAADRDFEEKTEDWVICIWKDNHCICVVRNEQEWKNFLDLCHSVVRDSSASPALA